MDFQTLYDFTYSLTKLYNEATSTIENLQNEINHNQTLNKNTANNIPEVSITRFSDEAQALMNANLKALIVAALTDYSKANKELDILMIADEIQERMINSKLSVNIVNEYMDEFLQKNAFNN